MSRRFHFPVALFALALVLTVPVAAARAQTSPPPPPADNMLRGPHPFLKENELSAHVLLAAGLGDTQSGTKLALDYGFRVIGPHWLNFQINIQHATCHAPAGQPSCQPDTGSVFETLAGVKWKWATPIPLVPYAKAGGGLVFVYPNGAHDAVGVTLRAAGGANYFFFDWLGLGGEVGFSIGHVGYDATFPGSHTYSVIDFGGGIEFQF
jgi:hypothetical protein